MNREMQPLLKYDNTTNNTTNNTSNIECKIKINEAPEKSENLQPIHRTNVNEVHYCVCCCSLFILISLIITAIILL